jgi:ATP-dependent protease ClpP protease subunit
MELKKISKKQAETKLYGDIGSYFTDGQSFSQMWELCESKGYEELLIRMHCYGGSVFEGNVIYNILQQSSLKASVIIDGVAASMGFFVLLAVEDVCIAENGFGMIHRPSAAEFGDADSHLSTAKLLKDMEDNFIQRMAERTGMPVEQIKAKWFDGKDHWLNADEMVQYGFAKKKIPATAKNIKVLDSELIQGITAEVMYDRFAAHLNNNNKKQDIMKKELIEKFNLQGVTEDSSETDILAKMQEKFSKLENKATALESEAKAKTTAAIKTILDNANISGDLRKTYEKIGETSGVEALAAILPQAKGNASVDITSLIKHDKGTATFDTTKNWDWYQKNDPSALAKIEKEDPEQFKALYKAEYGVYPV